MERQTLKFQPAQVCIFVSVDLVSLRGTDTFFGTETRSRGNLRVVTMHKRGSFSGVKES